MGIYATKEKRGRGPMCTMVHGRRPRRGEGTAVWQAAAETLNKRRGSYYTAPPRGGEDAAETTGGKEA